MRFRALGPITVEVDGQEAKLGGLRQQMVLAVLLSRANQVVSQDGLIDSVWAGEPPEAARATLQSYIYNLRRSIGTDAILRRGDGYLIQVEPTNFDVLDFSQSVSEGHRMLGTEPDAARTALLGGLALWFGSPYGGVDHPELFAEINRLTEMRISAIEARIQADLALGRDVELVGELETLAREYPFRERFWAQLMLALYRSGRQADALRTYARARARLVDDLGIEPGTELQRLEERILAQDPSLMPQLQAMPGTEGTSPRSVRGYELRVVEAETSGTTIYHAFQQSVNREVVVRAIRPEFSNDTDFVARFERDAQAIAGLEHPHILPLLDYWRDPTGAYLVMPHKSGGSLGDAFAGGGWSLERSLRLLGQVGQALTYAHRHGIVHGHLGASSIALDEEGNAYLGDFGVGRTASGDLPTIPADVFDFGLLALHVLTGNPPVKRTALPDLAEVRPDLPPAVAATVARATSSDGAARYTRVSDFLRDLRRAAGADVAVGSEVATASEEPIRNPYKGLRAFAEEDSVDFHGRTDLINELLRRISENRLVTLVGPSGSGKSSVVRAGVIPALRAGVLPGSRGWLITDMFPGSYPFEELEAALIRVAVRGSFGMMTELTEPTGLIRVCKQILPDDDSTLFLVIDQFEELFSVVRSDETRRRFLDNLIAVAEDERGRIRVITTIRADFLDRPLSYGDFAAAMGPGLVTAGPPTREGLAQAIAAPARAVGLELEPGLVTRVVGDVEGQPGALPLLQYALTETFASRSGSVLTAADYEATGGVAGALGRRAEELFGDLSPAAKQAAREVFLRLVSVDEVGVVTRRRARQRDLLSLPVDRSALESVLNAYAGFRLLSFDREPVTRGPTVEVAHEALLTEWPRLDAWIDEARESLVMARRVGVAAQEWLDSSRDSDYLLRGSRLEDVERWSGQSGVVLTTEEDEYIATSVAYRREEMTSTRRRRRRTTSALAAGLALVTVLAGVAFAQRGAAQEAALQARVRELATASIGQLDENRELALLIAVEAFDASISSGAEPNSEAVSAMAHAIHDWRLVSRFPAWHVLPTASRDGSLVAVASTSSPGDVALMDRDGSLVGTLTGPADPAVAAWAADFNPNGETVAVLYAAPGADSFGSVPDGVADIEIFDLTDMSRVLSLDTDHGWHQISYSPDGETLAVASEQEVRVLSAIDGTETSRFEGSSRVGLPEFLDAERVLVPLEGSGFTILLAADGSLIDHIDVAELHPDITDVNDARTHVAFRAGEHVRVLEIATGEILYDQIAPSVLTVALDPDATRLAHAGFDPDIRIEALTDQEAELELTGTLENVQSVAFVGERGLLSLGEDVLLWDVSPEGMEELGGIPLREPQWSYQISSDLAWLAYPVSTNSGGPIGDPIDGMRLIDLATGQERVVSQGEYNSVEAGLRVVSRDFTIVGSLTLDGDSTLRHLQTWDVLHEFESCRTPLAVTPDNRRVVLSGWGCSTPAPESAQSSVFDLASGEETFSFPLQSPWSAEFNPDGVFEGGTLLAATDQITVGIWDTTDGTLLGSLHRDDHDEFGNIMVLSFDPSGRYLVGGTTAGAVWVADLEQVVAGADLSNALVFNRQAHTGAAPVPAINGNGVVATAGFDGMVRLWDLDSEDLILEFGSDVGIPAVRFSPDGTRLLYPHGLSIRQIPIDPYELRALANTLLTRGLLADECTRYSQQACP